MASQIAVSFEHSQIACKTDSSACPQWSHVPSFKIFLLFKFFFTGIASLLDLHTKFLTLFGTLRLQISFHNSLLRSECLGDRLWSFSLAKNFYPDLTVYVLDALKGHVSLSTTGVGNNGILFIKLTSWVLNSPRNRQSSQLCVTRSMRSWTLISSKPSTIGDCIHGWSNDRSQASSHTLMDSPLPTLLLAPFNKTSHPFRILCQA